MLTRTLPLAGVLLGLCVWANAGAADKEDTQVHDLSLLVAPNLPCYWSAGMPPVQVNHYLKIGPLSPYNSDVLVIDEHTGTQWDAPAHFVPPLGSGLPDAGPAGRITGDKVPPYQFGGEACVIDCTGLLDKAKPGYSPLITKEMVQEWEKKHRAVGPGDVVVFHSGFSDKYYQPFPAGRRFIADPLAGETPGWPDPDPDCVSYLALKGVRNLATDAPSMGPLPGELPRATHVAGLRHEMIWTEGAIGLSALPATGAFYCMGGRRSTGPWAPATWWCSTPASATSTISPSPPAGASSPTRSRERRPAGPTPTPTASPTWP